MTIQKIKELLTERAKDLGLGFDPEDIETIPMKGSTIIWFPNLNDVGNVVVETVEENGFTWYIGFPQLVFILWDDGAICDKVSSINFSNEYKSV